MVEYLFLSRNFEKDCLHIHKHMTSFSRNDRAWWILFPEGTDMEPHKVPISQQFQRDNNLPVLSKVLQPKSRGLHAMLKGLRVNSPNTVVYDYTFMYDPVPTKATTILFGQGPKQVHVHMRRVELGAVGHTEAEVKGWCNASFAEKDRQLTFLAENNKFDGTPLSCPLKWKDTLKVAAYVALFLSLDGVSLW
eukprot:CAMPEP_0196582174 /NCGR_PEP_ID=MMETSP1081-20130531/37846_1 /TAXON_ID=36882 /ORGANISM="Pyramimonas amylifera, Strain CCMP720" /LENGTH=191 /DNA_ID=CAMNT_0041902669 /DNA_START=479 /DNA_END=1051 /DNA_ORIENTATION=+